VRDVLFNELALGNLDHENASQSSSATDSPCLEDNVKQEKKERKVKMEKALPYFSALLSIVAIVLASLSYTRATSQAQVIIKEREHAFIHRLGPSLTKMYDDMKVIHEKDPQTIEALLEPLIKLSEPELMRK